MFYSYIQVGKTVIAAGKDRRKLGALFDKIAPGCRAEIKIGVTQPQNHVTPQRGNKTRKFPRMLKPGEFKL